MRHIRYQEIADELRGRASVAPAGSVLPSEAEMSQEFGSVSSHDPARLGTPA